MTDRITFPSLATDALCYTMHSSSSFLSDQYYSSGGVAVWAGFYLTYGDGNTQHSHESPVGVDRFEDYMASLAVYLTDGSIDLMHRQQALDMLASHWNRPLDAKRVRFLATLKYREDKTQYYSKEENKTSTADARRHDKRWVKIERNTEAGLCDSVYTLLGREKHRQSGILSAFTDYDAVRSIVISDCDGWGPSPETFFELGDNTCRIGTIHLCLAGLVESHCARADAIRALECYRHNAALAKERAARAADTVAVA